MSVRNLTSVLCAALALAVSAAAQDKPAKGAPPAMSAEEKAAMEAMQRMATPGPAHKAIADMAGTWDAEVTMYWGPTPAKSKGVSENRLVLGGRWVEQRFKSEMMGQPFEGLGYTGYDNFKKKYVGTWMDNMTTAVMVTEGTFDAAGKVMTSTSTMDDVATGKPTTVRMTTTVMDADNHHFEMFGPGPDGKEMKQMEIHYRRRK
jgi:hypothetical protein